jgi:phosphonoacetaldehyde hydrolase
MFAFIKAHHLKLGVGTGLEKDIFSLIYHHLNWDKYQFNYIGTSSECYRGRPAPDMIFDMLKATGQTSVAGFLKVGDTATDIREGKNAGVLTAAVLSGTQPKAFLVNENPYFICGNITDVLLVIESLL